MASFPPPMPAGAREQDVSQDELRRHRAMLETVTRGCDLSPRELVEASEARDGVGRIKGIGGRETTTTSAAQ